MLSGKYAWIWNWEHSSDGNAHAVARQLLSAGFRGCFIKSDDGGHPFGLTWNLDRTREVVRCLHNEGLLVMFWGYVYGQAGSFYGDQKLGWEQEAAMAVRALTDLGGDGYIADAEIEFESLPRPGQTARDYLTRIKTAVPNARLFYSPFAQPHYHRAFPYDVFNEYCEAAFPMAYSGSMFPVGTQYYRPDRGEEAARRSYLDWCASGLPANMWQPAGDSVAIAPHSTTPKELLDFARLAISYGASCLSWWVYEYADQNLWAAIREVDLGGDSMPDLAVVEQRVSASELRELSRALRDSVIADLTRGDLVVGFAGPQDLRRVLHRKDGSVVGVIEQTPS